MNLRRHDYCLLHLATPIRIRGSGYTVQILLLESGLKKPCQLLRKHEWLLHWAWHPCFSRGFSRFIYIIHRKKPWLCFRTLLSTTCVRPETHKKAEDSMEFLSIISPTHICETRVVEDLGTNDSLQSLVSSFVLLALGSISVTRTDETA